MTRYVPDRGDYVWLVFNPQAGGEQAGRRPALVLSPKNYNSKTGLAIFCPVTSYVKGYPFEVRLPDKGEGKSKIIGAVLCDHIKSLDWSAREIKFIAKASPDVLAEVLGKLRSLIA